MIKDNINYNINGDLMIKTIINDIDNYDYILSDKYNNIYKLNLEFYGLNNELKKGDIIYFSSELLIDEGMYSFGKIKNTNLNFSEYIVLMQGDKKIYLQRYYG